MTEIYIRNKTSGAVFRTASPEYWGDDYETLSRAEGKRLHREQETKALRKRLKPEKTVYVKQTSVSRSGMSRRLELYVIERGKLERITYSAAVVIDWAVNDDGIRVEGCGMDMHFHTVYTLARYLFPKGFKEKDIKGVTVQKDGGYALKHSSI